MNKKYLLGSEIPIFSVSQPMLNLNIFGDNTLVWINELGLMTELVEHFPGFFHATAVVFFIIPRLQGSRVFQLEVCNHSKVGVVFHRSLPMLSRFPPTSWIPCWYSSIYVETPLGLIACQVISYQGCVAMEYAAKLQVGLGKPPRIFTWPLTKTSGQKKN